MEPTVDSDHFWKFLNNHKTETHAFWSHFLNEEGILCGNTIEKDDVASAESERGFSVINHIKNKPRTKLTLARMQDIMRIRLNHVDKLEKCLAIRYTNEFLKKNFR